MPLHECTHPSNIFNFHKTKLIVGNRKRKAADEMRSFIFRGAALVCDNFSIMKNASSCFRLAIPITSATVIRMSSTSCKKEKKEKVKVVPKDDVIRFVQECMCQIGAKSQEAYTVAHHLMFADYRGHFSHGINRLELYIKDIEQKIICLNVQPQIINDFKVRFSR